MRIFTIDMTLLWKFNLSGQDKQETQVLDLLIFYLKFKVFP